ncbi:MAG: hypothetical protein HRU43_02855 [Simkaniaceae bacterium]|nr:hypothetical protein [Simkaniaceae bacterium]
MEAIQMKLYTPKIVSDSIQLTQDAHQGLAKAMGGTLAKVAEGTVSVWVVAEATGYGETFNRFSAQVLFIGFLFLAFTVANTVNQFFRPPPPIALAGGRQDLALARGEQDDDGILPLNIHDVRQLIGPYQAGLQQARERVVGLNERFQKANAGFQKAIGQAQLGLDYVNKNSLLKITLIFTIGTISILILGGIGSAFLACLQNGYSAIKGTVQVISGGISNVATKTIELANKA